VSIPKNEQTTASSALASTREQIAATYRRPLLDLVFEAQSVHRRFHKACEVQQSALISVKTGACPEDCSYCAQSSRYKTSTEPTRMMGLDEVLAFARHAKENGASRVCMGSSGRDVKDNRDFEQVLEMVSKVKALGVETCVTLGMIDEAKARRLKEAGLDFYNHNIDTSAEFYDRVVTTRSYGDRIDTLSAVRSAGLHVCTGGILGLGETDDDRISFIHQLASMNPQPESVTINRLVPIAGTPLGDTPVLDVLLVVRTIATARLHMPEAPIRLSAGRESMSDEAQALCFLAGANSVFSGEKLLTTPNAGNRDHSLFERLGITAKACAHS
jgi:biotin synthase